MFGLPRAQQVTCISEGSIQLCAAWYNYSSARANEGNFILRLEDMDQSGLASHAAGNLLEDLFWAEIIPQKDLTRGRPVGPYFQSKHLELYK
ncbi:probable glutamate--tRNA ligase, mitochondrial [Athalia rosae]|uniref:probable glutamate--tRNA ligase, mitochondrial n=1 Tax=Athalia rosae TaxID=37344 RepID=UPI0020340E86|nr:probable glutamate--tRNA ligase, mitochondrial [Athalia rosae]